MTNKTMVILIGVVVVLCGVAVAVSLPKPSTPQETTRGSDYKNTTYTINGQAVALVDGRAETEAAPGSASKITTQFFGNEIATDLNGDGRPDEVFLLTQSGGGSGTFFYVVAALDTDHGYVGSDGYLLGDRIAPQTTEVSQNPAQKGVIVVNYADRAPGDPMTAQPSVGKSAYLKLDPASMQWGVVAPNFEGEADPASMSLLMKTWHFVSAHYNDGTAVSLKKPEAFTLTFSPDGRFSATTDCNAAMGEYATSTGKVSFSKIGSTKMFCQDSQEADFIKLLTETAGYSFTGKGELVLDLKLDSGSVVFQ